MECPGSQRRTSAHRLARHSLSACTPIGEQRATRAVAVSVLVAAAIAHLGACASRDTGGNGPVLSDGGDTGSRPTPGDGEVRNPPERDPLDGGAEGGPDAGRTGNAPDVRAPGDSGPTQDGGAGMTRDAGPVPGFDGGWPPGFDGGGGSPSSDAALSPSCADAGAGIPDGGLAELGCDTPDAFEATLSNGTIVASATVQSYCNRAQLCGMTTSTSDGFDVRVPASQIVFEPNPFIADGFIPIPAHIMAIEDATGTLTQKSDGLDMTLHMKVEIHAEPFGDSCVIGPVDMELTTGQAGQLTGAPLTGNGQGMREGTLVANGITIPPTETSAECTAFTTLITDANLAAGAASAEFRVAVSRP